jgi:hypothetical protein
MAGNSLAIQCKRKPTIAVLCNLNLAGDHYVVRRLAIASITLTVVFCLSNHTITAQSAAINRINGELFDITKALKVLLKGGKHGSIRFNKGIFARIPGPVKGFLISNAYLKNCEKPLTGPADPVE